MILPCTKAPPRKASSRGRKKGRTTILTNTPEIIKKIQEEQGRADKGKEVSSRKLVYTAIEVARMNSNDGDLSEEELEQTVVKNTTYIRDRKRTATSANKVVSKGKRIEKVVDENNLGTHCMFCNKTYERNGEIWIQCFNCNEWAHEECAEIGTGKYYYCDSCK